MREIIEAAREITIEDIAATVSLALIALVSVLAVVALAIDGGN